MNNIIPIIPISSYYYSSDHVVVFINYVVVYKNHVTVYIDRVAV